MLCTSLTTGAFSVRYLARVDAANESSTVPTKIAFCSSLACPLVLASESVSLHEERLLGCSLAARNVNICAINGNEDNGAIIL